MCGGFGKEYGRDAGREPVAREQWLGPSKGLGQMTIVSA